MRRRLPLLLGLGLLLAGCGGDDAPTIDLGAMVEYPCGYGFWLGSPDDDVAVHLSADHALAAADDLPATATLPDPAWTGTVQVGRNLHANWCNDVFVPPEPRIDEEWEIVAGTVTVEPSTGDCQDGRLGRVDDLVARRPDGDEVALGGRDVANGGWGCFAG